VEVGELLVQKQKQKQRERSERLLLVMVLRRVWHGVVCDAPQEPLSLL